VTFATSRLCKSNRDQMVQMSMRDQIATAIALENMHKLVRLHGPAGIAAVLMHSKEITDRRDDAAQIYSYFDIKVSL
jgi:hypothetical protein